MVRAIIVGEPCLHVIEARGVEVGHRADRAVMIGVALGKEILENTVAPQAVGIIVALPFLVLEDAAMVIELFLRYRADQLLLAVASEEWRDVEQAGRTGLDVIGT